MQTITTISEISTTIATAVEQQGLATQEIARSVQEVAQATQHVSSNISGVSQASIETGSAAERVLVSAGDLGKQATTLRSDVSAFLSSIRAA